MKNQKTKEYKRFNYPNDLSAIEQFYYYLLEFEAIPNPLPSGIVEQIFTAVAKDYLEGFIDVRKYESIVSNLYYGHYTFREHVISVNSDIDMLMDESVGVIYRGEEAIRKLTHKLQKYFIGM